MKKMFIAFLFLLSISVYSHAQTTPKAKKPAATATTAKPAAAANPVKKDGTPDMRYKSNKDAAKAAPATTHVKKDGTADKRYKENKK
jgi:hypothetical protein